MKITKVLTKTFAKIDAKIFKKAEIDANNFAKSKE
jgi:hypothetical protein